MPLSAQRTPVGFSLPLPAGERRGIQGVSLGGVTSLPRAHPLPLLARRHPWLGPFHELIVSSAPDPVQRYKAQAARTMSTRFSTAGAARHSFR